MAVMDAGTLLGSLIGLITALIGIMGILVRIIFLMYRKQSHMAEALNAAGEVRKAAISESVDLLLKKHLNAMADNFHTEILKLNRDFMHEIAKLKVDIADIRRQGRFHTPE